MTIWLPTVFIGFQAVAQVVFSEQDVSFQNGSVELAGTLLVPDVQHRVPAIVYLHGSGPMTRAGFRRYAEIFAKLGVASLFYDKRGTGASTGSWLSASLEDLAEDALTAIQYLKGQDKIDHERIGFWGVSQAGWIAPLAASRSTDVAFIILNSGGGASPRESELFSYRKGFEKLGLSESEETEALGILDEYFNYLTTGEGRGQLVATLDSISEGRLHSLANQLKRITPSEKGRHNWSWVGAYDPMPDIEKIKCPILLMFGDRDKDHPTELAVERWREGLRKAGNDDVSCVVFPGAGHGIRMREGHIGKERPPFADGYEAMQIGWLWLHVLNDRE